MSCHRKCIVHNCATNLLPPENRGHIFHLSRSEKLRFSWLSLLKREDLQTRSYTSFGGSWGSGVCSMHFNANQFRTKENIKLNINALPNKIEEDSLILNDCPLPQNESCDPYTILPNPSVQTDVVSSPRPTFQSLSPSLLDISMLPVSQPDADENTKTHPQTVRLSDLGVTRKRKLSPNKRAMYTELQQVKRTVAVLKRRRALTSDKFRTNFQNLSSPSDTIANLQSLPKTIKLFILSQLRNFSKSKKARRYTAQEQSFFLSIFKHSPKCYRYLRKLLALPSPRTLRKVTNNFSLKPGINDRVFEYLGRVSESMSELDRYCIIMFDEMEIVKHLSLVVGKNTCRVEGFVDEGVESGRRIADHALVFMIRGLRRRWKQPVAFYFTRSCANREVLKRLISDVIRAIHNRTNFKVVASVSDAGSWNVGAIRLLACESGKGLNDFIYNVDNNKIFHLFNAPHLIKCMRNNFINRNIVYEGHKIAKWADIKQVYFQDGTIPTAKMSKLTRRHVEPSHREKMRVWTAVQVFSHTTKMCLELLSHHQVINGLHTAEFVGFMNNLFDSLNSTYSSKNPLGSRLTNKSPHLDFWSSAKVILNGVTFVNEHNNKVSTPVSVRLCSYTLRNVQLLWEFLSGVGFKFLLTRSLNQDPVENFFSAVRGLCGSNTRPTSLQFASAYKTCVLNNTVKSSTGSNCEDDGERYLFTYDSLLSVPPSVSTPIISNSPSNPVTSTSAPVSSVTSIQSTFSTAVSMAKRINVLVGSYIAGFLIKRLLHHECQSCTQFLLTDTCTGIHDVIRLKEYSEATPRLKYPSESFIKFVNDSKDKNFCEIPRILHLPNFFCLLTQSTYSIPSDFCTLHGSLFQSKTVNLLSLVMVKHFIKMVNLKINNKDSRPNEIIDQFLRSVN